MKGFKNNKMISKVDTKKINNSTSITNNRFILDWMVTNQTECYITKKKTLSSDLLIELDREFGKHNKSMRLEFLTKIWVLEYKGHTFNVFSAKKKGTTIEICNCSFADIFMGDHNTIIIEFLTELSNRIN